MSGSGPRVWPTRCGWPRPRTGSGLIRPCVGASPGSTPAVSIHQSVRNRDRPVYAGNQHRPRRQIALLGQHPEESYLSPWTVLVPGVDGTVTVPDALVD